MPPAGFEPEIPTSERSQTYILGGAAVGIGGNASKWKRKPEDFKIALHVSFSNHLFTVFIALVLVPWVALVLRVAVLIRFN